MTIQIQQRSATAAKSKNTLAAQLNTNPAKVYFLDPSIFAGSRGGFCGADIQHGEKFPVVMDPLTRRRFATLTRTLQGVFKVT